VDDQDLTKEIFAHPSREFLRNWKDLGIDQLLEIYTLTNGIATEWTMEQNFTEKEYITL